MRIPTMQSVSHAAVLGFLLFQPLFGQMLKHVEGPRPAFELASVRENKLDPGNKATFESSLQSTPDRFVARNKTLRELIEFAYNLPQSHESRVSGGPSWLDSNHYTITAKKPESAAPKLLREELDTRLMLQSLLAERFHLVLAVQERQAAVLMLVAAKEGAKLTPAATVEGDTPRRGGAKAARGVIVGVALSTAELADALSQQPEAAGHPVQDHTDLNGRYDFTLRWNSEQGSETDSSAGPSLFSALREQLGLRLEAARAPVETLVVQHVERPTEN